MEPTLVQATVRQATRRARRCLSVFGTLVAMLGGFEACSPRSSPPTPAATTTTSVTSPPENRVLHADPAFRQARGSLLPGVPDFPAYPGATLLGSAVRSRSGDVKQGHRIEWTTKDAAPVVMAWYQKTLQEQGWTYTPPTDGVIHSQVATISRGDLNGTIEAETENGITTITVILGPAK